MTTWRERDKEGPINGMEKKENIQRESARLTFVAAPLSTVVVSIQR